ncbi:MAG: DUF4838 domain-containing protein [Clostridia bacterium]|nr:DUF4838 domain-containing protein [Clostridia bacterium]
MRKIGLTALSIICALCAVFSLFTMTNVNTAKAARQAGGVTLSKTKYNVSSDNKGMLLVTGIKDYSDVYEVGYTFYDGGRDITESVYKYHAETTKFYTAIRTGETVTRASDLFGAEYSAMIIWEVGYTPESSFTYQAYAKVGNREGGYLVSSDNVFYGNKKHIGSRVDEFYSFHNVNSVNSVVADTADYKIAEAGATYGGLTDDWLCLSYFDTSNSIEDIYFPFQYTKSELSAKLAAGFTKIKIPVYFTGATTNKPTRYVTSTPSWTYEQSVANETLVYLERNLSDIISDYDNLVSGSSVLFEFALTQTAKTAPFELYIGTISFIGGEKYSDIREDEYYSFHNQSALDNFYFFNDYTTRTIEKNTTYGGRSDDWVKIENNGSYWSNGISIVFPVKYTKAELQSKLASGYEKINIPVYFTNLTAPKTIGQCYTVGVEGAKQVVANATLTYIERDLQDIVDNYDALVASVNSKPIDQATGACLMILYNYNGTYGTDRQTTNFNMFIGTVEFVAPNGVVEINSYNPLFSSRGIMGYSWYKEGGNVGYDGYRINGTLVNEVAGIEGHYIRFLPSDTIGANGTGIQDFGIKLPTNKTKAEIQALKAAGYTKLAIAIYVGAEFSSLWHKNVSFIVNAYSRTGVATVMLYHNMWTIVKLDIDDIIDNYDALQDGSKALIYVWNRAGVAPSGLTADGADTSPWVLYISGLEFVKDEAYEEQADDYNPLTSVSNVKGYSWYREGYNGGDIGFAGYRYNGSAVEGVSGNAVYFTRMIGASITDFGIVLPSTKTLSEIQALKDAGYSKLSITVYMPNDYASDKTVAKRKYVSFIAKTNYDGNTALSAVYSQYIDHNEYTTIELDIDDIIDNYERLQNGTKALVYISANATYSDTDNGGNSWGIYISDLKFIKSASPEPGDTEYKLAGIKEYYSFHNENALSDFYFFNDYTTRTIEKNTNYGGRTDDWVKVVNNGSYWSNGISIVFPVMYSREELSAKLAAGYTKIRIPVYLTDSSAPKTFGQCYVVGLESTKQVVANATLTYIERNVKDILDYYDAFVASVSSKPIDQATGASLLILYNYNGTYGTDRQTTNFNLYIGTVEFVDTNYNGVKGTEYYSFHNANSLNEFDPQNNGRGMVMAYDTTYDGRKDDWVNITYLGSDFSTAMINIPMKYTRAALLAKLHAGYTKIRIPLYFTGLETPRTVLADYSSGWYYRQNLSNATLTYVERNLEDIIADYANQYPNGTHSFLMIYNNTYGAYESVKQSTTFNLCIGTIEFVKPSGVDIVKNATTDFCLVLPESPSRILEFAAKELNQFFYQATNLYLPIVYGDDELPQDRTHFISLGNSEKYTDNGISMNFTGLADDGYIIKCSEGNVYINSTTETGVLWGAYKLLESYVGVKFLSQEYTYVPSVRDVILDFETLSCSPEFAQRDMLAGYTHPYFYRVQQYGSWMLGGITDINWATDLGGNTHTLLNYFYVPNGDGSYTTSYPYSSNSGLYMNRTTSDLRTTDAIYTVNGADNQRLPFDICPSSGINTNGTMQSGTNAARIITNSIINYLKSDNSKTFFMLGIMDQDCECLCSTCKSRKSTYGGYSGVLTVFCNAVVNEVNAWIDSTGRASYGVDHYINVVEFAYYKTSCAPTKAYTVSGVNINYPNEHVYVYFAPLHANFLYGYNDAKNKFNSGADNGTEGNVFTVKVALDEWATIAPGRVMIYSYAEKSNMLTAWLPNISYLQDEAQYFKEKGVYYWQVETGYFMNYVIGDSNAGNGLWYYNLYTYLIKHLWWDVNADMDDLIDEFISLYHGSAATTYMTNFYNTMEGVIDSLRASDYSANNTVLNRFSIFNDVGLGTEYWTKSVLTTAIGYCDSAITAVNSDATLSAGEKAEYVKHITEAKLIPLSLYLKNYITYNGNSDGITTPREEFRAGAALVGLKRMNGGLTVDSWLSGLTS